MARLNAQNRQEQIIELLNNNGSMKATELADYFSVSRETIRRDLNTLSENGSIKKGFGGAIAVNDFTTLPIDSRLLDEHDAKKRIARKALSFIPEHGFIYLDTGSTTLSLALELKNLSGYTIITNSIPVLTTLIDSKNHLIFLGGECNAEIMCSVGVQVIELLKTLRVDIAFLGSAGFEQHHGPATNAFADGQIKSCAISCAQTSIVLCDSRKAKYSSFQQYASWNEIDHLISDTDFPQEFADKLQEFTNVILVQLFLYIRKKNKYGSIKIQH